MKKVFKNDRFKKNRGGYSRLLAVACQKCGSAIYSYQKDGPGALRRMYLDRISDAKVALGRKDLTCAKGHLVGVKIIYKKENRTAFRLFVDSVTRKIIKL